MVQPDKERQLDDVIMNVFEQSPSGERYFFFPVTSQKEARDFVHELHTRGVQYSRICATVGELEQNFTAWRSGLCRPVIGNRVVERINRPLQQLLLATDDQEVDAKFTDVEDDDDVLKEFSSSLPETPVKQAKKTGSGTTPCRRGSSKVSGKSGDCSTLRTPVTATTKTEENVTGDHVEHPPRTTSTTSKTDQDITTDAVDHGRTLPPSIIVTDSENTVRSETHDVDRQVEAARKDEIHRTEVGGGGAGDGTSPMTTTTTTGTDHDVTRDTVNHVDDPPSSVDSRVELGGGVEQPECEVVLKESEDNNNNNNNGASTTADASVVSTDAVIVTKTENSTPTRSQTDLSDGEVPQDEVERTEKTGRTGEVDGDDDGEVMKRGETLRQDSWVTELSVNLTTDSEPPSGEQRQVTVTSASAAATTQQPCVQADTTIHAATTTTTSTTETSSSNGAPVLHPVTADTDTPEVNGHVTSLPEIPPDGSVTTNGSSDDCTATFSHFAVSSSHTPEVNGHATSQPEIQTTGATVVDESAEPEAVAVSDRREMANHHDPTTNSVGVADVEATANPETTSQMTSLPEVTSEVGRKCVLRKTVRNRDDPGLDDIDENYNSDDDVDDEANKEIASGGSSNLERRGRQGRKRWRRRCQLDGPGYVYVFTDTASDCSTHCRVKVSASRRPEARLRQAQLFNVDLRLVTAVKVSSRLAATCLLRKQLAECAIPDTVDWFNTSLDVVVNGVMDVSRFYSPLTNILDDQM